MYKNENIMFKRAIQGNINFSTQELASVNSNTNQSLISSIINEPSHSTNFLLATLIFYSQNQGFHQLMLKKNHFGISPYMELKTKYPELTDHLEFFL